MKFTKILFCAMAAVASACFVSCTTSKEELSSKVNVEAVADKDGHAVAEKDGAKIEATGLAEGEKVSIEVKSAETGDSKTAKVEVPDNAKATVSISMDPSKPNTWYNVLLPNGNNVKVQSNDKGVIVIKDANKGDYIIAPITHNGGGAK